MNEIYKNDISYHQLRACMQVVDGKLKFGMVLHLYVFVNRQEDLPNYVAKSLREDMTTNDN